MLLLSADRGALKHLLVIGCHADDIEIGCGGTVLNLLRANPEIEVTWVVLGARATGRPRRARVRTHSSTGAASVEVQRPRLPRWLSAPTRARTVKDVFEGLEACRTRYRADAHALTSTRIIGWPASSRGTRSATTSFSSTRCRSGTATSDANSTCRWPRTSSRTSSQLVLRALPDARQASTGTTTRLFRGLMRLRGIECAPPSRYAEAFYAPKASSLHPEPACASSSPASHGYIGSVLAPIVARAGHEVVGLDTCLLSRMRLRGRDRLVGDRAAGRPGRDSGGLRGFRRGRSPGGVSNDPIGDLNEQWTYDINLDATLRVARAAKEAGVGRFFSLLRARCTAHRGQMICWTRARRSNR